MRKVVVDGETKVSVVDVIRASKDCDVHYANKILTRLVESGQVPIFALISCPNKEGRGGAQQPIPVANSKEILKLLQALPGDTTFKENAAQVMVRYLGGDPTLAAEVAENRAAQERLAEEAPDHPARIFGEAVERGEVQPRSGVSSELLSSVRTAVGELRDELRQTHVWSFSKTSAGQRSSHQLERLGHVVGGRELQQIDRDEHVIRAVEWLSSRFSPDVWQSHGRKFKSIFCVELKSAKLDEAMREGTRPFVTFNQGEYRLVYTEADDDLMTSVLQGMQERVRNIAQRDDLFSASKPHKQRRIHEFLGSGSAVGSVEQDAVDNAQNDEDGE